MRFEDFFEEFKKTGIGIDFYKTTLEFMITNSCCLESEKHYMTVYEYTIGLTHHGKKYELQEKNMFYDDGSAKSTYELKEVNAFSEIKYKDHIKIFKYGKCFNDNVDKEKMIASVFNCNEEELKDFKIFPDDIITEHIIIFPQKREIFEQEISGFFFLPNGEGKEISVKEYMDEFVNSLDEIIANNTITKKQEKINLETER